MGCRWVNDPDEDIHMDVLFFAQFQVRLRSEISFNTGLLIYIGDKVTYGIQTSQSVFYEVH